MEPKVLSFPVSNVHSPSQYKQAYLPEWLDSPKILFAHFRSNARLKFTSSSFRGANNFWRLPLSSETNSTIARIYQRFTPESSYISDEE